MRTPHHEDAVGEQRNANQMEQIERSDEDRIWLQEFPREALQSIPRNKQVETVADKDRLMCRQYAQPDGEKQQHRGGFIKLHRMAADSVAEIDSPGQMDRCSVGVVGQPGKETA